MNEEIIQKLKDAGFPNIRIGEYFAHRIGSHSDDRGGESDYPCYCNKDRLPTLSELIEACGERFYSLTKIKKDEWQCCGDNDYNLGLKTIKNFNKTPEEAVSNLWLALNEKKI